MGAVYMVRVMCLSAMAMAYSAITVLPAEVCADGKERSRVGG